VETDVENSLKKTLQIKLYCYLHAFFSLFQMKISSWSMTNHSYCQWQIEAKTQMDLSFLC